MKNFLIFLFGAGIGFGTSMIVLHKSIKKQLDAIRENSNNKEAKPISNDKNDNKKEENDTKNDDDKDENVPFTMKNSKNNQDREKDKIAYHKMVDAYTSSPPVPIMSREDVPNNDEDDGYGVGAVFMDDNYDQTIEPIDVEIYRNDKSFSKEFVTCYMGDHIFVTENGTKIEAPGILFGNNWEQFIGNYRVNTAFIRNNKLRRDYEIFAEEGLYQDDYGAEDGFHGR